MQKFCFRIGRKEVQLIDGHTFKAAKRLETIKFVEQIFPYDVLCCIF